MLSLLLTVCVARQDDHRMRVVIRGGAGQVAAILARAFHGDRH
jgi:hypothetical protein